MEAKKPVGLTAAAGFQIGVRRTLPLSQESAWTFLSSPDGLKLWLGEIDELRLHKGEVFSTQDGVTGEIRISKPLEQLRLAWKMRNWDKPSTLQIRLLPKGPAKTTISFHQEKLDSQTTREEMKQRWEAVVTKMAERFAEEA